MVAALAQCDNQRPKCSNCSLYQVDCVFGQDRRKQLRGPLQSLRFRSTTLYLGFRGGTCFPCSFPAPSLSTFADREFCSRRSPTSRSQVSFGNNGDGSCEPQSDVNANDLRGPISDYTVGLAEQQTIDAHLPRPRALLPEAMAQQAHRAWTPALTTHQIRADQPHAERSRDTGLAPMDSYFDPPIPEDSDLDYWVRLAEGPGHPVYSQSSDSASNHTAQMSYDSGIADLSESWPLENALWSTGTPTASPGSALEPSEQDTTLCEPAGATRAGVVVGERGGPDNKVTRELSSRQGRLQIAEDGHPRYYGATSNMHLLHNGPHALSHLFSRSVEIHDKIAITQATLDWPGDREYEEHLIDLFFAWHNPYMNVVDSNAYYQSRQLHAAGQSTPLYSLCLTNAM